MTVTVVAKYGSAIRVFRYHAYPMSRRRVTNVRACEPEPEPEPRAYFASHCVFFLFFFFFSKFNVNILLSKCYAWPKKQNFPIFFRALISAQVVFLSVSNLISSNGFRGSVYSFR